MRAGLVRRGAPALPHRANRFWGRQVCRGTPVAKGDRDRRQAAHQLPGETDLGTQRDESPTLVATSRPRPGEAATAPQSERLHYFVETEELRRILCLMAGTELLNELCQRLNGTSASEV